MAKGLRNIAVMVATCLGVASPSGAYAQSATPELLVTELWTDFARTCVPYLINPEKALAILPDDAMGFLQHQTPDRTATDRMEGITTQFDEARTVELHIGEAAAHIGCEVSRTENLQPFPPRALAASLNEMLSQLPGVKVTGGEMKLTESKNVPPELKMAMQDPGFLSFFLEGALHGRLDFVEVEIAEGLFSLYVAATVAREDWQ